MDLMIVELLQLRNWWRELSPPHMMRITYDIHEQSHASNRLDDDDLVSAVQNRNIGFAIESLRRCPHYCHLSNLLNEQERGFPMCKSPEL